MRQGKGARRRRYQKPAHVKRSIYTPFWRQVRFSCADIFFTFILIYILFMQNRKPDDNDD